MARPTVLIATKNPAIAYALQNRLSNICLKLGLRLTICPEGDGEKVDGLDVATYRSADALFDYLESRSPMEIADTLAVLDLGIELEQAFRTAVQSDNGWHVTKQRRAGVAVELLLRFPQVFPVFLSPAVPVNDYLEEESSSETISPKTFNGCSDNQWGQFYRLRMALGSLNGEKTIQTAELDALPALRLPLHFVSPLDGGCGLESTLIRFANGMRCWFDPTGLRTLVKNRYKNSH